LSISRSSTSIVKTWGILFDHPWSKTASIAKSDVSHVISKGIEKWGGCTMEANTNKNQSFSKAFTQDSSIAKGPSLVRRLAPIKTCMIKEWFDLLHRRRHRWIRYQINLDFINLNPLFRHSMTQNNPFLDYEVTLFPTQKQIHFFTSFKHNGQISKTHIQREPKTEKSPINTSMKLSM